MSTVLTGTIVHGANCLCLNHLEADFSAFAVSTVYSKFYLDRYMIWVVVVVECIITSRISSAIQYRVAASGVYIGLTRLNRATESCCRQSLTITCDKLAVGRLSELKDIVNLVD